MSSFRRYRSIVAKLGTHQVHTRHVTYETRKSDTTRSGIAQNSSVRTQTPHFNTPPRREFLIHHLTTATMPRVKARAAKNEEREEKIRRALEERAQFGMSFEDLHHKYGIPKSPEQQSRRPAKPPKSTRSLPVPQPCDRRCAEEVDVANGLSGVSPKTRSFQGCS